MTGKGLPALKRALAEAVLDQPTPAPVSGPGEQVE